MTAKHPQKTDDLEILLPHRAPMLLLSEVVDYDEQAAIARVHITEDSPFFDASLGGVPTWVGMEYMAQTIGIWEGHHKLRHNKPVQAGFLLGARRYECTQAVFPVNCTLTVSAKPVYLDVSGIGAFDCTISSENRTIGSNTMIATAQIKAFRPEDPKAFVRPFSIAKTLSTATGTSL